jgi:Anti-sigma-K factor rskA, C-terminal
MPPRDSDERELDAARDPLPRPDDTPDLSRVRRIGAAARSLDAEDRDPADPPPELWAGIADRVSSPGSDVDATGGEEAAGAAPVVPLEGRRASAAAPAAALRPGRGRRAAWWAIGAAAAAVVLVVAGAVVATREDGDAGGSTVASAELEPLPDALPGTGPGRAAVVVRDGAEELTLDATPPEAPDGFYEVWLIDTAVDGMVSLGPLRADGRYAIPDRVDVRAFPVVDVSIEPPDGEPTHSGRSVLRGVLS